MSQHARRVLAACGLLAVLLCMAPAPSRAAGLREVLGPMPGIAVRVQTWLERWLPGPRRANGTKQGSGIDPNGAAPLPSPISGSTSNQGSGIDPNGAN